MNNESMQNTAYMLEKRATLTIEQAKADNSITSAEERLVELLKDQAFVVEFSNCATAEEVKALMDRNGAEFSLEEVNSVLAAVSAVYKKLEENKGELSEEELEQIAGGWSWKSFFSSACVFACAAAVVCLCAASIICTGGGAAPLWATAGGAVVGGAVGGTVGGALEL